MKLPEALVTIALIAAVVFLIYSGKLAVGTVVLALVVLWLLT